MTQKIGTQMYTQEGSPFLEFCNFYGKDTPEDAILNACESLFYQSKASGFPRNLSSFLKTCNARVVQNDMAIDGRLEIEKNGFVISIPKKGSEFRKRFTIAHEIGHILILDAIYDKPQLVRQLRLPSYWKIIENLCDFAASEILAPTPHFIDKVKEVGLNSEGIDYLCNYFGVSKDFVFVKFVKTFNPATIALCKSQYVHGNKISPYIVKVVSSLKPDPFKKGPLPMNNLMQRIIGASVRYGRAWSKSLVGKIEGKNTRIFRLAILNSNSVHYKQSKLGSIDGTKGLEKDVGYYDTIIFYLPLEMVSNSVDLIEAIQRG